MYLNRKKQILERNFRMHISSDIIGQRLSEVVSVPTILLWSKRPKGIDKIMQFLSWRLLWSGATNRTKTFRDAFSLSEKVASESNQPNLMNLLRCRRYTSFLVILLVGIVGLFTFNSIGWRWDSQLSCRTHKNACCFAYIELAVAGTPS